MLFVFLVSSRRNLTWCIGRVHYEFLPISSVPLTKGLYIDAMIIFVLRPILMLDMLGTKEIKNLLQGIAHI